MTDSATPADDVWTVQRILQWTTVFLEQKDIESARLEAELLLACARNCPRIRLYTDFEEPLTDPERSRMRDYVKRRAACEPLAYITGQREFYGREFSVGTGVLIPRPETETLVDVCLEQIPQDQPARICEAGFGSGCISVTLARQRPRLQISASDLSEQAMEFAQANISEHDVEDQIQLYLGDGCQPLLSTGQQFDGLVSNPPYIREDELPALAPEVAQHEPRMALVSGQDGLDMVRQLAKSAPDLLKPGGWIALEVDPAQCPAVDRILAQHGFVDITIHKDLSTHDRVVSARRADDDASAADTD